MQNCLRNNTCLVTVYNLRVLILAAKRFVKVALKDILFYSNKNNSNKICCFEYLYNVKMLWFESE
jgi:hypothetical protein